MVVPGTEVEISCERNLMLLNEEIEKSKLNGQTLKYLMARTFYFRADWVCTEMPTLNEVLSDYP